MKDESIELEKFIQKRIKENKNLFSNNDIKIIEQNESTIKKVYLLGFINAKDCYRNSIKT